jgi:cytochrome c551/c552
MIRAISYGGGVQSTALLVLAAQGRIDYRLALMANTGDDSEHPETLTYVHDIAIPYAEANGIEIHLLHRERRDGTTETLLGRMTKEGGKSLPIPVRYSAKGPPVSRACTADFKTRVTGRWLKRLGATAGKRCKQHKIEDALADADDPKAVDLGPRTDCKKCAQPNVATVALGISLDEIHRANTRNAEPHERLVYPLISIGEDTGLRLRRDDCMRIIADAGLPIPPKSSCFFCPFHTFGAWQDLARERPDLFEKSAQLEEHLTSTRAERGKGPVFLSRAGIPLRDAIGTDQDVLFDDTGCDSGWCHT